MKQSTLAAAQFGAMANAYLSSAVHSACQAVFGRGPVLLPSGGSIPFVGALAQTHRIDVALLGFGLPDDAIHAPNERFYLPNLLRGTEACIELYWCLGHG